MTFGVRDGALVEHARQGSWNLRELRQPGVARKTWAARRGIALPRLPHAPVVEGRVWAVTMVRDEEDIIAATIEHLLDQGVDHVLVADNRSVDRTADILAELAASDPRIHLAVDREPAYFQAEKMTRLVQAAGRAGAAWVIPFDADEFWFAEGCTLKEFFTRLGRQSPPVGVVRAQFLHMVPEQPHPADLRAATFVMDSHPSEPGKVAVRGHRWARVTVGNHFGVRVGERSDGLFIAHALYRGPAQVARKVRQGTEAVMLTNPGDDIAPHWRAGNALQDEVVAEVWDNLSHGRPDARLNYRAIGPMVRVRPLGWPSWDPDHEVPR